MTFRNALYNTQKGEMSTSNNCIVFVKKVKNDHIHVGSMVDSAPRRSLINSNDKTNSKSELTLS